MTKLLYIGALTFFVTIAAHATSTTIGAGSAVTSPDALATFDTLTTNGQDLSNYAENGISITVPDTLGTGFDPFNDSVATTGFHYGDAGNHLFVTISMADNTPIAALEFKVGDGWLNDLDTKVIWETMLNGVSTGTGAIFTTDATVIGWIDSGGFDELRVAASGDIPNLNAFGDLQGIAIDNLSVQVVPVPAAVWLFGSGLGLLGWFRRRSA